MQKANTERLSSARIDEARMQTQTNGQQLAFMVVHN